MSDAMKPPSLAEFDPEYSGPAECAEARESLQQRLDGDAGPESVAVVSHRLKCADCRSWEAAARRLEEGLKLFVSPQPSPRLVDRVFASLQAEPARARFGLRRAVAAGLALAACVLVAVAVGDKWFQPEPLRVTEGARPAPRPKAPEAIGPSLADSLNEAGSAVAELTRKTAGKTLNIRLPSISLPATVDPLERLGPAVASIQEVRNGAVFGIAPITNSAKRAMDMFLREVGTD
jgi:hypothetical protein